MNFASFTQPASPWMCAYSLMPTHNANFFGASASTATSNVADAVPTSLLASTEKTLVPVAAGTKQSVAPSNVASPAATDSTGAG